MSKNGTTGTRRHFLKESAAMIGGSLATSLILPGDVLGKDAGSPNSRFNLAYIGLGRRAKALLHGLGKDVNIVALCDADRDYLRKELTEKICPKAKFFTDFRQMLDEMGDEIDGVVIATPNHTHYPIAMEYAQAGKHIYMEKPLTNTVWEARELAKAEKKYGVVTQMGNQGRSTEGLARAKEWYKAGLIGDIVEVHAWTGRHGCRRPITPKPEPVPKSLDWDMWIGPAEMRKFASSYLKWRHWWDFGGGPLYDIGCHTLEAPLFALDTHDLVKVKARTSELWPGNPPHSSTVEFHMRLKQPAKTVKVYWYDGGNMPDSLPHLEPGRSAKTIAPKGGAYMVGTKAGLILPGMRAGSARLAPEKTMQEWARKLPPKTVPRTGGHMQNWINACRSGGKASSSFADYAVPLSEIVMLGVIAKRTGQLLNWDSAKMRISNSPAANKLLYPHIRESWKYKA